MNPLFAQLALDWLSAERIAYPDKWPKKVFSEDELAIACDRVFHVLSGEVRYSEASPGDRAIWKGRVRDVVKFLRAFRDDPKAPDSTEGLDLPTPEPGESYALPPAAAIAGRRGPRVQSYRERTWWNYYDTAERIGVHSEPGRYHLFGNKNIGQIFLTNMQIGGQFTGDETFVVLHLYVNVSNLEALHWAADHVGCQFIIGNRDATPFMFVRDLFRGITLARPLIIPVRQNFSVAIDLKEKPPADLDPFDLTFHLEGLRTREIG